MLGPARVLVVPQHHAGALHEPSLVGPPPAVGCAIANLVPEGDHVDSRKTSWQSRTRQHLERPERPRRPRGRADGDRERQALLDAVRAANHGDFAAAQEILAAPSSDPLAPEINELIGRAGGLVDELVRLSIAVGREGQTGQRASVGYVEGAWGVAIEAINALLTELARPMADVSRVIRAIAEGDFSQRMQLRGDGYALKGELSHLATVVNALIDRLNQVISEVTRVAREVGTDGKLGAEASVVGASGTWRDLTNSVNMLAGNLTNQVRNIALVTTAVANGDLSRKIDVEAKGEVLALKNTINVMVDQLRSFAGEVTRVAKEVGTEGRLGGQAEVRGVSGVWKDLTDNVNAMAFNLTTQVRGIVKVVTAVAHGDLSQQFVIAAQGEIAALAETLNWMTKTLSIFAEQVTSVARTVGVEGKLGGQAKVPGATGTWRQLTDNVNQLAGNLTTQIRTISDIATAVTKGDLSRKITVEARGEVQELKNTINTMVDTLNSFAAEVTRVAREVGTEGKLGGQADVKGVAGTWKDLTDNVNLLANNLTAQVRNIAEVTTAVAKGDLSKKIT
ncbi:MAG: HAMP domain-containing protein, partial [Kofleriaceae bacterium]